MPGFDYANARIRAMKSRLLSKPTVAALAEESDVSGLLNALTRTPYQAATEAALVKESGLAALRQTLQSDLNGRIRKIETFFTDQSAELVQLVLLRYDVDNLKAVLRGVTQQLAAELIVAATIPQGKLASAELTELAQTGSAREVIDLLATWRYPLAQPLLTLRVEQPGATLWQMEMALEQWYFQKTKAEQSRAGAALHEYLHLYADITNIMTVLRLVGLEGKTAFLSQHFKATDLRLLLIGPGHLPFSLLLEAAQTESVHQAVEILSSPGFDQSLHEALKQYRITEQLSSFEKMLQQQRLRQALSFFVRDPHGIGIFLGYLVLSNNEIANLLHIGHGLHLRRPVAQIKADLLFTSQ